MYRVTQYTYTLIFFFFQAEDGIRDVAVTGVQTCALPISTIRLGDVSRQVVGVLPANFHFPSESVLRSFRRADQSVRDRKSTRLNSSHGYISYAVFCLKKKNTVKMSST